MRYYRINDVLRCLTNLEESADKSMSLDVSDDEVNAVFHDHVFSLFGYSITRPWAQITISTGEDLDFGTDANLHLSEYIQFSKSCFNENNTGDYRLDLLHCAVGVSGEAGEILDLIKKHIFHNKPLKGKAEMAAEAGDLAWYLTNLLRLLGISFTDTLRANVIKLKERYPDGRDKNWLRSKDIEKENSLIKQKLYNRD